MIARGLSAVCARFARRCYSLTAGGLAYNASMAVCSSHPIEAAGIFLRRWHQDQWYWLLLQDSRWHEWGFPKGHRDPGETLRLTALRECAEECGIGLLALDGPCYPLSYQLTAGRNQGQRKVVWYYAGSTCQSWARLSDEHDEAQWLSAADVIHHLAHENLRELFRNHCEEVALWL